MQKNSLRYFIAIAEHSSLRSAAETLHISQSALSRQVINLEEEMGAPLLERLPRGIGLTSVGQVFLRYARDSMAQYDLAKAEISALQGLHRGTVHVATPEAFCNGMLPDCMRMFRELYPGVHIVVRVSTTRGVVADVREGLADFGIAYNPEIEADMRIDFSVAELLMAVMRPDNPLAGRESLWLAELADVPLVLPLKQSATGDLVFKVARRSGITLRTAIESNSVKIRLNMAIETDAVALLGRITAVEARREGRVVTVPMRDRVLNSGHIRMFSLPRRRLSAAAQMFQTMMHAELQKIQFT